MIIDYDSKYQEEVKSLLMELQEYIVEIDQEHYNVVGKDYKEKSFQKELEEVEKMDGKILLYQINEKIVGCVVGFVNNEEINCYDFKAPKRGRIYDLVVSKEYRLKGYGTILLKAMENYLKSIGCMDILLGVFGYNDSAIRFYEKNGYHTRMVEMTKKDV